MSRTLRTFAALLVCALPGIASAATLSVEADTGAYGFGDTFFATVRLDTDTCINAAEVSVSYPAALLRAVDFSRGESIFSLWVQEPILDTERGVVT